MSKAIKTNKTGVYYKKTTSNDKVFYFNYRDKNDKDKNGKDKLKWVKVGKYSEGIREANAKQLRDEQLSKMRHNEDITVVSKKKKKEIITLDSLANIYFEDKHIIQARQNKYNMHIKPIFGNANIENISKQDIEKFLNKLSKDKAPATVNTIRELLSTIINHSIKEHSLNINNPCTGVKRKKVDNDRDRYLTSVEVNSLYKALKDDIPIWLFVKLSLSTGGRANTILTIQRKDIDLIDGNINLKNHKTGETYKGYLQDDLIEFLKEYLKTFKLNDYVCTLDSDGGQPTYRRIQNRIVPTINKLFNDGLAVDDRKNRAVVHTLRHTFASHLAINGTPIYIIQNLMNHKKIEQTLRYAKLAPDSGKENVKGLYL